jgi:hypothetical protein
MDKRIRLAIEVARRGMFEIGEIVVKPVDGDRTVPDLA